MKKLIYIFLFFTANVQAQSELTVSCFSSFKFYDAVYNNARNINFNSAYQPLVINHMRHRLIYELAISIELYDISFRRMEDLMQSKGFDNIIFGNYGVKSASRIAPSVALKYAFIKRDRAIFYGGIGFAISNNYYNDIQIIAKRKAMVNNYNVNEIYTSDLSKNRFTYSYNFTSGILINLEKSGKYILSIESGISYLHLGSIAVNMKKLEDSNNIDRPEIPIKMDLPTQLMTGAKVGIKYRFNQIEE
ncbi:MAG: hypothetical protein ACPGLV_03925 [Bacteroidia bacterium]